MLYFSARLMTRNFPILEKKNSPRKVPERGEMKKNTLEKLNMVSG